MSNRRSWLALAMAASLTLSASGVSAQSPAAEPSAPPSADRTTEIIDGMSPRQKVGQLFMSRVYGDHAATPSKRAVASNRRFLAVDDATELLSRYHVGFVIDYGWAGNLRGAGQVKAAAKTASKHDITFVFTGFLSSFPRQRKLVRQLLRVGGRVVIVSAWSPYDVGRFPSAPGHIVTYGTTPLSMRSLAKLMSGEIAPTGALPVRIPKLLRPKSSLFPFGSGKSW